ncbi:MAG: glycerate kinase [Candidatus Hydrogenedentales bacterium]|jgi:glycerate kinase
MRFVIAPDSFKECAPASVVANAIARGLSRAVPQADLEIVPMADGGEGTVDSLVSATGGTTVDLEVTGPLGDPVKAVYGLLGDGSTAVIEMAAASGLELVAPARRDPRIATTRGTGELISDALDKGVARIIVGIGGSATNDAGAGMAQALGYSLLDSDGNELGPGGAALASLARIDATRRHRGLDACELLVACDVTNPLYGPEGASFVYGPQKGATPEIARELDAALRHFAEIVAGQLGIRVDAMPGGGAAGGLGAGLVAFAGAHLQPGVEIVAAACNLAHRIEGADLVITGEGRLDGQSAKGKTPVGVARIAKRLGVPCIAIAGALGPGFEAAYTEGVTAAYSLCTGPMSSDYAMENVEMLLESVAESIARTWTAARGTA